jgi:hypothetical protein
MFNKILSAFLFIGACTAASAQVYHGTINLYYVGLGSDDGAFEWSTGPGDTGTDLFTYCFSTNNLFDPWSDPEQTFMEWTIAGATTTSVAASGMLDTNAMSGLTPTNFLEAAAQAQSYGPPDLSSESSTDNANIHNTESNGDASYAHSPFNEAIYLEQDNPASYSYAGQPQVFVSTPHGPRLPTPNLPGPLSALPMAFGVANLAIRRKLKKA